MAQAKTKKKTSVAQSVAPVGKKAAAKTALKSRASLKKVSPAAVKQKLYLPAECAVTKKGGKPRLALPAQCGIEKKIKIPPPNVMPVKTVKRFFDFSLSPRKSFWVGVIFGIAVMSVLVVCFWALLSAQFVWASIR